MTTIYSFVNMTSDKQKNVDMIENGISKIPEEGKVFSTGFLRLDKPIDSTFTVLLCKVATGKSLGVPIKHGETKVSLQKKDLLDTFDSVCL
jgi:hypothetical protein